MCPSHASDHLLDTPTDQKIGNGRPAVLREKPPQGVKVTIYLPPEVEQMLRKMHISRPAPCGHFYGLAVQLLMEGLAAREKGRHAA